MLGISKKFLGGDSDMVVQNERLKPGSCNILWGETIPQKSLEIACKLQGQKIDISIPKKWKRVLGALYKTSRPNIKFVVDDQEWKKLESHWVQQLDLIDGELSYFNEHFVKHMNAADSLSPICINEEQMRKIYSFEKNESVRGSIKSFWSGDKFAEKIKYNFTNTITGRMTVTSGPQICTIRKDIKKQIIQSRFENGSIIGIDYTSIEPKFALWKAGKNVDSEIYSEIAKTVFNGINISRGEIKHFVLATLYGSGPSTVAKVVDMQIEEIRGYLKMVKKFFSTQKISDALSKESQENGGIIYSHFGRAIYTRDNKNHILFSNYNQSSATTACLDGFCNMIDYAKKEKLEILPIAFIHDEIIFDCSKNHKRFIEDVAKKGQINDKVGFEMTNKIEEY